MVGRNTAYFLNIFKPKLYAIITATNPKHNKFKIDAIFAEAGHFKTKH